MTATLDATLETVAGLRALADLIEAHPGGRPVQRVVAWHPDGTGQMVGLIDAARNHGATVTALTFDTADRDPLFRLSVSWGGFTAVALERTKHLNLDRLEELVLIEQDETR